MRFGESKKELNCFRFGLSVACIVFLLFTSCESRGAVPAPVPLNAYSDKMVYWETSADGSMVQRVGYPPSISSLVDAQGYLKFSPPAGASSSNPIGYQAKMVGGAPVLEAAVPVQAVPPAGAPVNSSTSAAALAAAGGAGAVAATGALVKSAPLASSLASSLAKTALGVGVGTAAFLGSPLVASALTAASVGMLGYQFYQALKGQGVTLNSDGSSTFITSSEVWRAVSWYGSTPQQACQGWFNAVGVLAQAVVVDGNPKQCAYYISGVLSPQGPVYLQSSVSNSSPATNDQLIAAVNAATMAADAATDAVNFSLARGVPLPADLPAASPSLSLASGFSEVKTSIDSLGNTVKTLERNLLNFSPSTGGAPPVLDARKETVVLQNSVPQSVVNTSLAPNIATAAANAAQQKTADLCQQHPDILACADIAQVGDVPDDVQLVKKDVSVNLNPVSLPQNLICPPPITFRNSFGVWETWDLYGKPCAFGAMMKPIVLAFAWLAAGMIVFVGRPYA